MGKPGKWLKNLLTGKKEDKPRKEMRKGNDGKNNDKAASETSSSVTLTSAPSSKEKRRWSFGKLGAAAAGKECNQSTPLIPIPTHEVSDAEMNQKRHAVAVAIATAAAADAAVAAAHAAAAVVRLTTKVSEDPSTIHHDAAVRIQSAFRSYLARKALCALKGLVKLQALVRGHLVRKQATATLRCMHALVIAQERARLTRMRMFEERQKMLNRHANWQPIRDPRYRLSYSIHATPEDNIKIVEMDHGGTRGSSKSRRSYSIMQSERSNRRFSSYTSSQPTFREDGTHFGSPSLSALTEMSPRVCSGHFKEFFTTVESSPHYLSTASVPDARKESFSFMPQEDADSVSYDFTYPNYMANTESSRAKARSQSTPKQRSDTLERPPSRRQSLEGWSIPKSRRMQRTSSSHIDNTTNFYPWSIKLDKSSTSVKESECGSTSTTATNTNYCKSLTAYEAYGRR